MGHTHICVWIDHREARIFGIGLDDSDEKLVREPGPHHHIHRKADQVGQGKDPPDESFYDAVAAMLDGAQALLIIGPGEAKHELVARLKARHPALAADIWGIEAIDHPTDPEIVARARRYFHDQQGLHG